MGGVTEQEGAPLPVAVGDATHEGERPDPPETNIKQRIAGRDPHQLNESGRRIVGQPFQVRVPAEAVHPAIGVPGG